jgi:hypothetical protein
LLLVIIVKIKKIKLKPDTGLVEQIGLLICGMAVLIQGFGKINKI